MANSFSGPQLGLEGYEEVLEVGRGGFGVVYRARQTAFDRDVAIKVLLPLGLDDSARTRFERECKAMGALSWHPNILTIYEAGTTNSGRLFLTMEFAPGGSLEDRLQRGGLDWKEVVAIGTAIASGLEAAHEHGVFHCDVKPANILLTRPGDVALGDFGIAALQNATHTRSGNIASVAYAAPEVLDGRSPSPASDVYSLGATLFALINGAPAFVARTDESVVAVMKRVAYDSVPDLTSKGAPPQVSDAIARSMSKEPAQRWASASAFQDALTSIDGGDAATPRTGVTRDLSSTTTADLATSVDGRAKTGVPNPRTRIGTSGPWLKRHRPLAVGIAAGVLVLALVAGAFALVGSGGGTSAGGGASSNPLRYTFQSSDLANGVTMTRVWLVRTQRNGELDGQLSIHNQTAAPWTGDATEVIPKSLATSVDNIAFHPQPDTVLQRDPAVLFHFSALAPNADATVRYTIALAAGTANSGHLRQWVRDQQNTPTPTTTTATTTTTTTTAVPNTQASPARPAPTACDATQSQFNVVNYNNLPIRTAPGPSTQIGSVPEGACVTVFCTTQGTPVQGNTTWDRIGYEGITGYSADQYINTGQGPGSAKAGLPSC